MIFYLKCDFIIHTQRDLAALSLLKQGVTGDEPAEEKNNEREEV